MINEVSGAQLRKPTGKRHLSELRVWNSVGNPIKVNYPRSQTSENHQEARNPNKRFSTVIPRFLSASFWPTSRVDWELRNQCPLLVMYRSSVVGNTGRTGVHPPQERVLIEFKRWTWCIKSPFRRELRRNLFAADSRGRYQVSFRLWFWLAKNCTRVPSIIGLGRIHRSLANYLIINYIQVLRGSRSRQAWFLLATPSFYYYHVLLFGNRLSSFQPGNPNLL